MIIDSLATYLQSLSIPGLAMHTNKKDRGIYCVEADQGAKNPKIVIDETSDDPEYHMGGQSTLANYQGNIEVYANRLADLKPIKELLRKRLSGFRGKWDQVDIRRVSLTGNPVAHIPPHDGAPKGEYLGGWFFDCWYCIESTEFA